MTETAWTAGPLLGPIDRLHFLEAQKRHRRATWRAALVAPFAVAAAGIPLCAVITPLLVVPVIALAFLLEVFVDLPAEIWESLYAVAYLGPTVWYLLWHDFGAMPWTLLALLLVVPGAAVMAVAWIMIRVLFRRAWMGAWLERLGVRPPTPTQLGERRLVNLIEELAVAAGTPPPRVVIVDSPAANAVALGVAMEDSTIAVTTGLASELSRDEAQAFLGHLVGSIGNGDLKIAASLLSVFQAWGLLTLLVEAPYSETARSGVRTFAEAALGALRGRPNPSQAEAAMGLLLEGAELGFSNLNAYLDAVEYEHENIARSVFVDLPLMVFFCFAAIVARAAMGIFTVLVFGPVMAYIWRTRRRLADAAAVELTRNPEALAGAVRKLAGGNVEIPRAAPIAFLFPIWSPPVEVLDEDQTDVLAHIPRLQLDTEERLKRLAVLGAFTSEQSAPPEPTDWRHELSQLALWVAVSIVGFAVLLLVHLASMSLLLWLTWTALTWLFVTVPAWALGLFRR